MAEVTIAKVVTPPQNGKRHWLLNELISAFSANGKILSRTELVIAGTQLSLLLLLWCFVPSMIPHPAAIWHSYSALNQAGMWAELYTSFVLNLEAMAISLSLSLLIAYATVVPGLRFPAALFTKTRFLSMAGLVFVFGVYFGFGHGLKLSLLVFGTMVFELHSLIDEVRSVEDEELDYARTLRMSEPLVVWEVIILGKADRVFDIFRANAAMSWMMLTMVEGISRTEGGIGGMLLAKNKSFDLAAVFAIQLVILGVGVFQDTFIGFLKRQACPYARLDAKRS